MKFFTIIAAVIATLIAAPISALDLTNMSKEDRAQFGAAVRAFLVQNPEVIVEAISVLEQRKAQAESLSDVELIQENYAAIFDDGYSWETGNLNGDITLVEFMDYRCGYCRKAHPEVLSLLEDDKNIRLIIKEFPILGPQSELAARFAISIRNIYGADAYEAVHNTLIAYKGDISDNSLEKLSKTLGFDYQQVKEAMTAPAVNNEIAQNHALAQKLQITGTPSFVLPTRFMRGFAPKDVMADIIAQERSAAK